MPAMVEHNITLEVVAELYRQAGHAGVLNNNRPTTTAAMFESLRSRLPEAVDPKWWKACKVEVLRAKFAEASAVIEEVNRLQGLALAIEQYHRLGRNYLDLIGQILKDIETRQPAEGTCFAAFPPFVA